MKKILVCDDDTLLSRVIEHIFTKDGIEVSIIDKGTEVVSKAKEESPSIIILDLMMPDKDGLSVLEDLKADSMTSDIPVVVMSAIEKKEEIDRAFNKGSIDYIVKPFDSEEFHDKIIKYM